MTCSHPHYLTFTLQTYHHQEHQYMALHTHMISPSHLHTQTRMQKINTYNHSYVKFFSRTKQSHTQTRQNNLHSVHSRPCGIYEQSGPQNNKHSTTHCNAPKYSGSYLRPKTQTYNICMTRHSYFPFTSTYSSTRHNTNRKHNIHRIPSTNIQHTSTLQGSKPTIFNNGRYTTYVPTLSLQQTYKLTCVIIIHTSI